MDGPASLVGSTNPPVVPVLSAETVGDVADAPKTQAANKNGKRAESGSGGSSFFSWFIVLALLGVWTSVAVVYFDLVDYQGVLDKAKGLQINLSETLQGKLVAYDTDGDGDFDIEDAKVLLDEKPGEPIRSGAHKEIPPAKDVGFKLREALKQQLAIIHERVEAKRLAKLALAEVRQLLLKEEEQKELELGMKQIPADVKKRVAARLKEEEERIEKEEMEKLNKVKTQQYDDNQEEESKVDEEHMNSKKPRGKEAKIDGRGAPNQSRSQREESGKQRKVDEPKRRKAIKA
uniref:Aspartyl beta-hydroxylase/Triadin domain-containing protein n=1 Tax=Oryzias latipes TaxID=8090 RepID=A0A3P9K387_ORYLA